MPAVGSTVGYAEEIVVASAARTATGEQLLSGFGGADTLRVQLNTTAVSGTSPSMTVTVEDTLDGTNYNVIDTFTAVTATNRQVRDLVPPKVWADRIKVRWAITGTTPSFTFDVRIVSQSPLT